MCRGYLVEKRSFEAFLRSTAGDEAAELSSSQKSRHEAELRRFAGIRRSDGAKAAEVAAQRRRAAAVRAAGLPSPSTSALQWTETLPFLALISPFHSVHSLLTPYSDEREGPQPPQPSVQQWTASSSGMGAASLEEREPSGGADEEDAIEEVE